MDDTNTAQPLHRRARRWPLLVGAVVAGMVLGAAGMHLATRSDGQGTTTAAVAPPEKGPLYHCPMHPTITSDHPGDCPICGMKLVPVNPADGDRSGGQAGRRTIAFYRSPMDPKQTSPTPRKDEMGMDYLPVYSDELAAASPPVPGLATVAIEPVRQQLIGLRTAPVAQGPMSATWRTVARIQVDPTRVRQTNVKVEGFVERIFVDFVGQRVRKGGPLFSVYSPTLLSAQNEYLLALQTKDTLAQGAGTSANGASLVEAARRRLELFDVPATEIERLTRTREPSKTLTLLSPIAGVVTAKNVVQGARVSPGEAPYEITDLSMVWVMADAYESDLPRIQVRMKATLTLAAYPGRTFPGEVVFIDPLLDPQTRTAKVHVHFVNPGRELKPGMYGELALATAAKERLHIPVDAVIRAGNRDVVFVALGQGKFEPRAVQLGVKSGDQTEVTGGLQAGEEVVTRANFLVDSESQLRASLAGLGGK